MSESSMTPTPGLDPAVEAYDIDVEAVKSLVCPRCEAKPTEHCVTLSGRKTDTHSGRTEPLAKAYNVGWAAGRHNLENGTVGT